MNMVYFFIVYTFRIFVIGFLKKEQDYINYESRIYTHLWSQGT